MPDTNALRILDANLNRAREALRVMEDYARFVLNDSMLTATAKGIRHDIADIVPPALEKSLIAHRDILFDVGTRITAPGESERSSTAHVATAAGKRLGEALRVIEEYGKILEPRLGAQLEQVRYRGYELERRLAQHSAAVEAFGQRRLYVLLTESHCRGPWFDTAEAALSGGADCLQLREKSLPDRELLRRAIVLGRLCRDLGALFLVNDRPDIAALGNAHGVHLGQDDLSVSEARRVLPDGAIIGVSSHSSVQALDAVNQAPGYIAVGPMFESATKPQDRIAGIETLRTVAAGTSLPLVAIGGINEQNAEQVLSTANCCLAVCEAVIAQADVRAAAERLRAKSNSFRDKVASSFANATPMGDR